MNTQGAGCALLRGHVAALLTILFWGTTFIATKVLLDSMQPIEILFSRFLLGYIALWIVAPHPMRNVSPRQELHFAAVGFFGIFLYYLLENIALTYTFASNVGVMVVVAPLFTALLQRVFLPAEGKLRPSFFAGFLLAMTGIALISFNGASFNLSPRGDMLAILAALAWACYSLLVRKAGEFGYSSIQVTRRSFFYGLVFMLPALWLCDASPLPQALTDPVCLANIIFLGLGASAICFVSWNFSIHVLGTLKTSVYIYLTPVVTVFTSHVLLDEPLTAMICLGTVLTLAGLALSSAESLREAYRLSLQARRQERADRQV